MKKNKGGRGITNKTNKKFFGGGFYCVWDFQFVCLITWNLNGGDFLSNTDDDYDNNDSEENYNEGNQNEDDHNKDHQGRKKARRPDIIKLLLVNNIFFLLFHQDILESFLVIMLIFVH